MPAKPSVFTLEPLSEYSLTRLASNPVSTPRDKLRDVPRSSDPMAHTPAPTADATDPIDILPATTSLMTTEDINGMTFVRIEVPAVRERQAFVLTDPLCDLADRTYGKMTLDLTKVAAFSCSWINVLLTVSKRCKVKGGSLTLTGLATTAKHSLKQMGLLKQFTVV